MNGEVDHNIQIDTGAEVSEIPFETAQRLKLEAVRKNVPTATFGGTHKTNCAILKSLDIGTERILGLTIAYPTEPATKERPGLGSILGVDILSRYTPLIDYPGNRLYLKPRLKPEAK